MRHFGRIFLVGLKRLGNPDDIEMNKSSTVRVLIWTIAGTVIGFCLLASAGLLERYPLINSILWLPAPLIAGAMFRLGLAPAGDAGFVIYPVSMVLQWTVLGFIGGICRALWLKRVRVSSEEPQPSPETAPEPRPLQRLLRLGMAHRFISAAIGAVVLVTAYCVWQEVVLSRDRAFFLHHVDHKAVAEACFSILSKPEAERWQQVALYLGADSRLPEAIRRLDPKAVSIHVDDISITKTPRHFYNRLTFRQERADTNRYDLVYEEGPSSSRETCVYTLFAVDRHPATK